MMKKEQALFLSHFIEKYDPSRYQISKLETVNNTLTKFHQWTNNKKVLAGYKVSRIDTDTSYFFIFIDWHRNDNYYLVNTYDKSTTVAEIRQIEDMENGPHLIWKYNPLKRDGKNDQRKAYFKQTFGSTTIEVSLPKTSFEIEGFFDQLFQLCQNRIKADQIVDVFDFGGNFEK